MPSVVSHAIAAVAIGAVAVGGRSRATLWALGSICAVVPDLDVVSFFFVPASPSATRLWVYFFLATASHGFLDSMTNGGLGVAFFAPFSNTRYFLQWRPIVVSPISIYGLVGRRGLIVMWSELAWVWLPAALIFLAGLALWRSTPREAVETNGGRSS